MLEKKEAFREKLLGAQEMSEGLRGKYRKELEGLLSPPLTGSAKVWGVVLLVLLVGTAGAIVRTDLVYTLMPLVVVAHQTLMLACLWGAWKIVGSLRSGKYSQQSAVSIAMVLTSAAGTMTVVALMMGVGHATEVKTLFGAFYVFVFYFACAMWGLEMRIGTAELAAREQGLRIEYRLAELAERMKGSQ